MARLASRGEIWTADLRSQGIGWEVAKKRPALIISTDQVNFNSPVLIVIPISSKSPPSLGFDKLTIKGAKTGLVKDSFLLITQIRAIDKKRLVKKIGDIPKETLLEVEESLKLILGLVEFDN